ncbi:MAG: penicillin-insensitive murein endopeptidase [Paracoccaceae bacterium]|nr:penicillin-insensitive murein endopeptidase [Paracoccaceae bacterium]
MAGTHHVAPKPGEPLANRLFGAIKSASHQRPRVIGFYSKGCLAGAQQLPETGPTWQVMRLSRNRNWGHPELIAFIKRLSRKAHELGWKGLYIGDMSQPRGGPMTSGHASHQVGLDVDIWMLPPRSLHLSRARRETISSISVRTPDQRHVNRNWTPTHMAILKAAAEDPVVERIFVAAAVKIDMCKKAGRDRKWLAKIRPLYGHNTHFHVRLKCPRGSPNCRKQTPISKISHGDGCDKSLYWWVTDYLKPHKKPAKPRPHPRRAREMIMADLPRQCMKVLKAE